MNRLSTISLVLHCLFMRGLLADCEYYYSEQPPQPLDCDPYETRELRLECTAHGPVSAEFDLAWFGLSLSDSISTNLLQGADGAEPIRSENGVSILSQMMDRGTAKIIRSQLRVQLQRNASITSEAVRAFWCSVTVSASSGSIMLQTVPSKGFVLHASERYNHLPGCGNRAQSSLQEKCALQLPVAHTTLPLPGPSPSPASSSSSPTNRPASPYLTQSPLLSLHPGQSSSPAWQLPVASSQLPSPTISMLAGIPPVMEERTELGAIVFPVLACLFGAVMLCLVVCVYTQCYRRRKNTVIQKKFAPATNHTYSLSNSIYHCEGKGVPVTPSLSSPIARSKLSESQDISIWSNDQYVEMEAGLDWEKMTGGQHAPSPSYSTLNRNGLQSSSNGPFSYEVPLPCCLEPDYASIPTLYDQYLIPTENDMDPRLYENSHIQRQQSPSSCDDMYVVPHHNPPSPAQLPSNSHHYEEIIHTTVNTAYLETVIPIASPPTDTAAAPLAADSS